MDGRRVTRDDLTTRLTQLQESLPGVRMARRARGGGMAVLAVLALATVLLLSRRSSRRGATS
ncbi:MAG: hypothetical protein KJS90_06265 [Acidobacteria bacterium]|nr:hypothetical protein [Acidobacteriota bacterium]